MTISQTANAGARSIYMVTAGESLTDAAHSSLPEVCLPSATDPGSAQPGTTELQVTIVGNAYTQWTGTGHHYGQLRPRHHGRQLEVDDESHISADINIGPTCTAPTCPWAAPNTVTVRL